VIDFDTIEVGQKVRVIKTGIIGPVVRTVEPSPGIKSVHVAITEPTVYRPYPGPASYMPSELEIV
jgi:hypothetical protein